MKLRLLIFSICFSLNGILNLQAQIGNPAPNFTVTDIDGNTHTLYDYLNNGKKVLLDFFFTTCVPCQYYSPQVNLAYQKYGCNQGDVIFMSIDLNNNTAEVHEYEETYNIEFPSISGDDGGGNEVIDLYNIGAFPTFYLIDSTYKIIDVIDPPTLQVFDFRFGMHDIQEMMCSVATSEVANNNELIVYPNPANDELFIKTIKENISLNDIDYKFMDLSGRLLLTGKINENKIITSQLTQGFYLLEINKPNLNYFAKVTIR